jgi:hypothetical protein
MVSLTAAQQVPQPVVRLGDWVEIGPEVFMNIIATGDLRYRTTKNYDFEGDIQDRVSSRDPFSTLVQHQECDCFFQQANFGSDFRWGKNLTFQILFRWEGITDGNLSDAQSGAGVGPGGSSERAPGSDIFGNPAVNEAEVVNLERLWLDYRFPGTPVGIRVGTDLWTTDQAGLLGDDDPRFRVYARFGPKEEIEVSAAAVIQSESQRIGLQNDNDFIYYTFGAAYNLAPHRIQLDVAYFRERFQGAGGTNGGVKVGVTGQETDSVLIMPSFSSTIGPVAFLVQPMVLLGTAKRGPVAGVTGPDLDIFAWGAIAYAEANLGIVRPFVGLVYGSGDDDPFDNDLNGFMTLPQREITLMSGTARFAHLDRAISFGSRDLTTPARAHLAQPTPGGPPNPLSAAQRAVFGGTEFSHTVGNPLNDRIGNASHVGINTTYSNPGTVLPFVGVKVFPLKGHELDAVYFYRRMVDSRLIELAIGRSVDESQWHELMAAWLWTISPHFDIRLTGNVVIPGEGAKDIAGAVNCRVGVPCEGEDVALAGEARFRARF